MKYVKNFNFIIQSLTLFIQSLTLFILRVVFIHKKKKEIFSRAISAHCKFLSVCSYIEKCAISIFFISLIYLIFNNLNITFIFSDASFKLDLLSYSNILPVARNKLGLNKQSYLNKIFIKKFSLSPFLRYPDGFDDIYDPFSELQPSLYPDDGGPVDNDGHILMKMRRDIESIKPEFNQT